MPSRKRQPRGLALIMVVMVVALSAVLGYAMLANSALQAQMSGNVWRGATADVLAESGLNVAVYYLQFPSNAPSLGPGGYWTGGTVSFGSVVGGTSAVTVSQVSTNVYDVVSTSTLTGNGQSRTVSARVQVNYAYTVNHAFGGNAGATLRNVKVTGDLKMNGLVTVGSGSSISGTLYGTGITLTGGGTAASTQLLPSSTSAPVPTTIKDYSTYTYNGQTYSAVTLSNDLSANTVLGPTPSNPAGLYIRSGVCKIYSNVTINGSLILTNGGRLELYGDQIQFKPANGFPAIIAKSDIRFRPGAGTVTANGLVYVCGGLTDYGAGNSAKFNINGALQFAGNSAVNLSFTTAGGSLKVVYTPSNLTLPDFTSQSLMTPRNVSLVSWQ